MKAAPPLLTFRLAFLTSEIKSLKSTLKLHFNFSKSICLWAGSVNDDVSQEVPEASERALVADAERVAADAEGERVNLCVNLRAKR